MEEYYRKRAPEYEAIYMRPNHEIQEENHLTAALLKNYLKNLSVLEIACGTGYWTQFLSETAKKIVATDILEEVLSLARKKIYHCPIEFKIADAYNLPFEARSFNGSLVNFWLSHIPKERIDSFITNFHEILQPNSRVFLCDNNFVEGMGGPIISTDDNQNTFKLRTLSDGSDHQILKNYYSIDELCSIFSEHVKDFSTKNIVSTKYYWRIFYELK